LHTDACAKSVSMRLYMTGNILDSHTDGDWC